MNSITIQYIIHAQDKVAIVHVTIIFYTLNYVANTNFISSSIFCGGGCKNTITVFPVGY